MRSYTLNTWRIITTHSIFVALPYPEYTTSKLALCMLAICTLALYYPRIAMFIGESDRLYFLSTSVVFDNYEVTIMVLFTELTEEPEGILIDEDYKEETMKLYELFKKYTWEEIKDKFCELYPDQTDNHPGYAAAYQELSTMNVGESNYLVVVEHVAVQFPDEEDWYHVYATDPDGESNNRWAIDYIDWSDCLDMEIQSETLINVPEHDILCHVIYELTFCGYSSSSVKAAQASMMDTYFDEMEEDDFDDDDWDEKDDVQ